MHSMSESATHDLRGDRRAATARRIHVCARDLAATHGLDGFSMDELADAAGVSRRTLFNYFPGKDAAVLGDDVPFSPELVERFEGGGPHGVLVDDLVALVVSLLDAEGLTVDDVRQVRALMLREPRLIALAHQRFEVRAVEALGLVARREGAAYDESRARVLIRVIAVLFDHALDLFLEAPDRDLADIFRDTVRLARQSLA